MINLACLKKEKKMGAKKHWNGKEKLAIVLKYEINGNIFTDIAIDPLF